MEGGREDGRVEGGGGVEGCGRVWKGGCASGKKGLVNGMRTGTNELRMRRGLANGEWRE